MVVHMIYLELHPRILTYSFPWDVEFAFTHTSRELNASSEVPSVFLGHVWYLDFLRVSSFPYRFESENHARPWFCLALRFSWSI